MENLIVITRPEMLPGEAETINRLFTHGLARLHVRKPDAGEPELRALLESIDPQFRGRIALHQHHGLAGAFGITGLHFTERHRLAQREDVFIALKEIGFNLSTSLHNEADLASLPHSFDYALMGPVFNSISKQDYVSQLPADFKLNKLGFPGRVIALGGIQEENLHSALEMGFDGAGVLGSIWQNPADAVAKFHSLTQAYASLSTGWQPVNEVARFHFISQENGQMSHIESIRLALEAGCRWIQLRVKDRPEAEVLPIAWEATRLCDSYGARLIINDFPRVALAVDAWGLHLGLTDMPIPEARALVGRQLVIGGTANTWDDIVLRVREGADYIGLGPFRFTTTKQNLSPIVGLEGYRNFMQKMVAHGYSTPIIGIGGITPADVESLRAAGLHGVAMSGALVGAADPKATFHQIQNALC